MKIEQGEDRCFPNIREILACNSNSFSIDARMRKVYNIKNSMPMLKLYKIEIRILAKRMRESSS
jgi:hypothetical protein